MILHLLRAVCAYLEQSSNQQQLFQQIKFVHFIKDNEFEEINAFRKSIEEK